MCAQASALDLEPFLAQVKDKTLQHALEYGIGYLHETMPQAEQDIVTTLFASNAIQVYLQLQLQSGCGRLLTAMQA